MKPVQANTGSSTKHSLASPRSHRQQILAYLQNGGRLTFFKSVRLFRCRALAQRISELRAQGYRIKSKMVATPNGAKIAEYWIEKEQSEGSQ